MTKNHIIGNSRIVVSNQQGVHPDLAITVEKHAAESYQRPIAEYAQEILYQIKQKHQQIGGQLILDSGCGTGLSTYNLAKLYPADLVVGIDQSDHRLAKDKSAIAEQISTDNVLFFRANLVDLCLLMEQEQWQIDRHFLFYPNPWPKKKHLQRRWHGHPIFPSLLNISQAIELRSNWKTYVEEFALAVEQLTKIKQPVTELDFIAEPITPFEKKYQNSGQGLYRYQVELKSEQTK